MRRYIRLLPLAALLAAAPACSSGYVATGVSVGAYGDALDVYGYSPGYWGDWHTNYRAWAPTTVYEVNGAYYSHNVKGARQVQVYHTDKGYVLPPRDHDWTDKRFSSKRMPNDQDYSRARSHQ